MTKRSIGILALFVAISTFACSSGTTPPPPACDSTCEDSVAVRALRETIKQVFNGSIQNMPVGPQDATYACSPLGGTAHVSGTATSNADVGTTTVDLVYVFDHCRYLEVDTDADDNYDITVTGTIEETGTIAVQPGSTTALSFTGDAIELTGTVYSPPLDYGGTLDAGPTPDGGVGCPVALAQNGNQISGLLCGRSAGVSL
ncbi:MAG TPA: hypothetical protein VF407_13700 [Polyangiaceae bacterium]